MRSPFARGVQIAAAVASIPALLFVSACSNAETPSDAAAPAKVNKDAPLYSQLPESIKEQGRLNVASYIGYPPFESYADDNTTVVGIDRDIADALEEQFGVPLVFANVPFDSIIPGLASQRYDLAMSAMSDTVERQKQVDFVDYYQEGESIVLAPGSDGTISTLDDLCGRRVGNVKGTTTAAAAAEQSTKCITDGKEPLVDTVFPGQNEAVLAVTNKRVEALLLDTTTATHIADSTKTGIEVLKPYKVGGLFGIVFPKGSDELVQVFQAGLEALAANGTYLNILAGYGLEDSAVEEFTVNGVTE